MCTQHACAHIEKHIAAKMEEYNLFLCIRFGKHQITKNKLCCGCIEKDNLILRKWKLKVKNKCKSQCDQIHDCKEQLHNNI